MLIETDRCLLMDFTPSDRYTVQSLYQDSRVREFLGGILSTAACNRRFHDFIHTGDNRHLVARLKASGAFVGLISLGPHQDGSYQEISYQLRPELWGRGLAREIVAAVMDYAKTQLNLPAIAAETQEINLTSRRLLEAVGMQLVTTLTRHGTRQAFYCKDFSPRPA